VNTYCLDRSPSYLLYRASQCAEEVFRQSTTTGLTPRQLVILMVVAEFEGVHQAAISRLTGIDRTTMHQVVQRLARRKLLQRRRSQSDKRAWVLNVTTDGREEISLAEPVALLADARVLDALPRPRREAFVAALQAIVATSTRGVQARRRPPTRRPRRRP
jgi:MarR family transcriptional regulator, temperature-dependent positive regulator of motility